MAAALMMPDPMNNGLPSSVQTEVTILGAMLLDAITDATAKLRPSRRQRYTLPMALTLDPATEQRIQRELARGAYNAPAELIAHALDLVEAERHADDWLLRNRDEVNALLEESFAQKARGEMYSPEEAHRILADRRAARAA